MPSDKKYGLGSKKRKGFDFTAPSGDICRIRALTADDMLALGILDQIDSLASIVQAEHIGPNTGKPSDGLQRLANLRADTPEGRKALLEIFRDKEKWNSIQNFINTVVAAAVLEPTVTLHEPGPAEQEAGGVYVGDIPLWDRMAVMTAALQDMLMPVEAMEPFRSGPTANVGTVEDGERVQLPTFDTHRVDIPPGGTVL